MLEEEPKSSYWLPSPDIALPTQTPLGFLSGLPFPGQHPGFGLGFLKGFRLHLVVLGAHYLRCAWESALLVLRGTARGLRCQSSHRCLLYARPIGPLPGPILASVFYSKEVGSWVFPSLPTQKPHSGHWDQLCLHFCPAIIEKKMGFGSSSFCLFALRELGHSS